MFVIYSYAIKHPQQTNIVAIINRRKIAKKIAPNKKKSLAVEEVICLHNQINEALAKNVKFISKQIKTLANINIRKTFRICHEYQNLYIF